MTISTSPPTNRPASTSDDRATTGPYRLLRPVPERPRPPRLDAFQQAVVDHPGGPLLVLAGPGTGKTTTLVEAVARRVRDGMAPERILVLTFSRRAAVELRDRITARLDGATAPWATTFHSFCYAMVRAHQDPDLFSEPVRLLSGPEQDVMVRELLAGAAEDSSAGRAVIAWPDDLRACLTTRGFADEVRAVLARSRELGLGPDALAAFAKRTGRPDWQAAAGFLAEYLDVLDARGVLDYAELVHRAVLLAEEPQAARRLRDQYQAVFVDEYQDTDPAQVRLLQALAGEGPTAGQSAHSGEAPPAGHPPPAWIGPAARPDGHHPRHQRTTPEPRSLIAFGDPDQAIYAFRGADINGIFEFRHTFTTVRRFVPPPARDLPTPGEHATAAQGPPTTSPGSPRPADVAVLRVSRRAAPALLAASRALTRRMPIARLPADAVRAHRDLICASATHQDRGRPPGQRDDGPAPDAGEGAVTVLTFPTPGAELDTIADILRRAHLEDGVPWGEMAVLVRAGARSIPGVRRALGSAGVPLEIAGDDLPLREEPAVAPLLLALEAVIAGPWAITVPLAIALLASPLGGLDAADLRRLGRALREEERAAAATSAEPAPRQPPEPAPGDTGSSRLLARIGPEADQAAHPAGQVPAAHTSGTPVVPRDTRQARADRAGPPPTEDPPTEGPPTEDPPTRRSGSDRWSRAVRPSDELIAEALAHPERLVAVDPTCARPAMRLGRLLRAARAVLDSGGSAEQALWIMWNGTPWPQRLERTALRGGAAGRNADRDLDAVCALFETAARAEERGGHRGAENFLEELKAQDIAADVLHVRQVPRDAVRLMTAHRAKGLEWRLVIVAGVQDGLWPDLRRRGSLLEADRIGRDGLAEPLSPGALLAEERRLFYVAVTRARERLVVTAVKAPSDDGDQPSRFLKELGVEPSDVSQRPRRPLSVTALVAELRAKTVDPDASPALREAAADRLARLAALRDDDGHPLVPSAHPERWWGIREPTRSQVPVRDPNHPVALSGSALQQLTTCSLQWLLAREVRAEAPSTSAQGFGNVLHVLADEVGSGRTPADLGALMERLDSVWDALAFDAPWKSEQEKGAARQALERFLHWHVAMRDRVAVATEHPFELTLSTGQVRVRIRGTMDRVERDADGLAYVVDFKTGRQTPSASELRNHPQLAVYQLAIKEGAVDGIEGPRGEAAFPDGRPDPGGAELVQLRQAAAGQPGDQELPLVQIQEPPQNAWVEELLAQAATRVLAERFVPSTGRQCDRCAFHRSCSARPEGQQVIE